jgi:hypothetical protein
MKGDLIYFDNGQGGAQPGHVGISLGDGNMVNALNPAYGVCTIDIKGGGTPMGAIRLVGSTGDTGATDSNPPSSKGTGYAASQSGPPDPKDFKGGTSIATQNLPDPRDNRPFHPFFSVHGQPRMVRGGMFELLISKDYAPGTAGMGRQGGQFACFFMMNPASISVDCAFDPSVAPPSTVDPKALASVPYWMQNQTISWSIIFNRQYEVWEGGVKNPWTGGPGPSDVGVRWDIRALERLMGMYDFNTDKVFGKSAGWGVGTYGPGSMPPSAIPIQVVFGGPNSYQFQGSIASFDYTYTMFDINMIPVEAQVDISVMRQYLPMLSKKDVVQNWAGVGGTYHGGQTGHVGGGGPGYSNVPGPYTFNNSNIASKMYQV